MQRAFVDPGQAMEVPPARDIVPQIQDLLELFRARAFPWSSPSSCTPSACPAPRRAPPPRAPPRRARRPRPGLRLALVLVPGRRGQRPTRSPTSSRGPTSWSYASTTTTVQRHRARRRSPRPGVTSLVLTGTMTDICVLATAIGGFNREYRITVVEDAVATSGPRSSGPCSTSRRAYGRVLPARRGRRSPSERARDVATTRSSMVPRSSEDP